MNDISPLAKMAQWLRLDPVIVVGQPDPKFMQETPVMEQRDSIGLGGRGPGAVLGAPGRRNDLAVG